MKTMVLLAGVWLLLAPLPPGIALNLETKECAGYWAGDEYVDYKLPEGWVAYEVGSQDRIETEVGTCTYAPSDGYGAAESCCRELGYRYTGDEIGKRRPAALTWIILAILGVGAGGVCLVIGLVVALVVGAILLVRRWRRSRQEAGLETDTQPRPDDAEYE
jgi:hypothetical protein